MSATSKPTEISADQAAHALRLFEKGYSVAVLARLAGVDHVSMVKALERAQEARAQSRL